MREWFRVSLQAPAEGEPPTSVDVTIYDYIGDWLDQQIAEFYGVEMAVTPKALLQQLSALPDSVKTIRVRINSPGGDMFGGLTIANALRDQRVTKGRTVETVVEGLAASAASLVFMAGSPARISDNGILMIHDPWNVVIGNSREMRKNADVLDQFTEGALIPTYQWHTELSPEKIRSLIEAETWMGADEAIDQGFADEKVEGLKAAASIDPRSAAKLKIPEQFKARIEALLKPPAPEPTPEPEPEPKASAAPAADIVRLCAGAGLDLDFAHSLLGDSGISLEAASARIEAERTRRAAATVREREIRDACKAAKLDDLADGLVKSGMTAADARVHLGVVTAVIDEGIVTDGSLRPEAQGAKPRPANVIDVTAILAERNRPRA